MERNSKKRHLPFLTAMAKANQRYGLELSTDEFVESAYDVWRSIGNIAPKLTRYFTKLPSDFVIELPKDCEFIESVTAVDQQAVHTTFDSGGEKDRHVPGASEHSTAPGVNQSLSTSPGRTVNYTLASDNSIYITSANLLNSDIMIVYRSLDLDEEGLPLINDKEVSAIAAEVTRRETVKKIFQGAAATNKALTTLLQYIVAEADRLMAAAKVDEVINDNALDKFLDIKTSWDRKVYGRRFSLIK